MRQQVAKLTMCKACGYVACICAFKKKHADDCVRRVAVLDEHPEACKPHGMFACADCFPCDCGGDDDTGT